MGTLEVDILGSVANNDYKRGVEEDAGSPSWVEDPLASAEDKCSEFISSENSQYDYC